eukprot:1527371-Amphidinium_carterae.1
MSQEKDKNSKDRSSNCRFRSQVFTCGRVATGRNKRTEMYREAFWKQESKRCAETRGWGQLSWPRGLSLANTVTEINKWGFVNEMLVHPRTCQFHDCQQTDHSNKETKSANLRSCMKFVLAFWVSCSVGSLVMFVQFAKVMRDGFQPSGEGHHNLYDRDEHSMFLFRKHLDALERWLNKAPSRCTV